METDKNIITTEDLTYIYDGGETRHIALEGVSIALEKGSFTAILGHNGSGKSTLAKHFNAILLPYGGTCYVAGMDTRAPELIFEIRRRVGMVFQNPDNQIIASIVEEDVAFAPENLGLPRQEIIDRVEDSLKAVDMYEFRSHAPHLLSGGQKQRIAIAGVLAMRPECIVLDEPTAMLDPRGRVEVLDTVIGLGAKYGLTIVLITHHMSEAQRADRVIVLNDGRVFRDGTPKEVFSDTEELRRAGLEPPAPVLMLEKLRALGADLPLYAKDDAQCAQIIKDWIEGGVSRRG